MLRRKNTVKLKIERERKVSEQEIYDFIII